ncbi:FERM C and FERM N and FERM M domain containing pr otein [Trichuris trichiura]|uniref:Moesin/ezrin/radixin homolog 1 n=1 Tax=Trichuris trichiura TaxID=36087 RepID=A0A077Z0T3_TRITR|nr:FERM C and FERM N and FERM M domain containing pr otein [Trichuris trichiura]
MVNNLDSGAPASPYVRSKKGLCGYEVLHLDGTTIYLEVETNATGGELFQALVERLNLLEKDYFNLSYVDRRGSKKWLDHSEKIKKQIPRSGTSFAFEVKFYPTDPSQLHEDFTRYLLCLQVHKNIVSGVLPCSFYTYCLLGSYFIQAQLGDFDSQALQSLPNCMTELQFPCDQPELLSTVRTMYEERKGQTPAEAERNYLNNARRLALYGVELHGTAKDASGAEVSIGICADGILILSDFLRLHRFAWQRIYKVSYFRNHFSIQVRSSSNNNRKVTAKYAMRNTREAKVLWKSCVAHHVFFRLMSTETPMKHGLFKFGSGRFQYPERTQYQTRLACALSNRPPAKFLRSFRGICKKEPESPVNVVENSSASQLAFLAKSSANHNDKEKAMSETKAPDTGQVNKPIGVAKENDSANTDVSSVSTSSSQAESHSAVIQPFSVTELEANSLRYDDSNLVEDSMLSDLGKSALVKTSGVGNGFVNERSSVELPLASFSAKHQSFTVPVEASDKTMLSLVSSPSLSLNDIVPADSQDFDSDLALLTAIYNATGLDPNFRTTKVEVSLSSVQAETEL